MKNDNIINEKTKKAVAAIIVIILLIIGTVRIFGFFYPDVKTLKSMEKDIKKSKNEAVKALDSRDELSFNEEKDLVDDLIGQGLDTELFFSVPEWVRHRVIFEYQSNHIGSVEGFNKQLENYASRSGIMDYSCQDIDPVITGDGRKLYGPSEKIINSEVPAIQFFDVYFPVDSSMSIDDAIIMVENSKENIKVVEVKTVKKGKEVSDVDGIFEPYRYVVYEDTPEEQYETNYLLKISIDTYDIPNSGIGWMQNYIKSVVAVSDEITDNVYLTGGVKINDAGMIKKIKYSTAAFRANAIVITENLKIISGMLLVDIFAIGIFIGLLAIFAFPVYLVVIILLGIVLKIISIIIKLITLPFGG